MQCNIIEKLVRSGLYKHVSEVILHFTVKNAAWPILTMFCWKCICCSEICSCCMFGVQLSRSGGSWERNTKNWCNSRKGQKML